MLCISFAVTAGLLELLQIGVGLLSCILPSTDLVPLHKRRQYTLMDSSSRSPFC